MRFHITPHSANAKTGALTVTTSTKETCPPSCPFYLKGCYAGQGHISWHWAKVTSGLRGLLWPAFLAELSKALNASGFPIWRHNQAGDLAGLGDHIDLSACLELANVSKAAGKLGFTYTHKPLVGRHAMASGNLAAVKALNAHGSFTVNASANTLAHADQLAAEGLPVCVTVPDATAATFRTPAGRKGIVCPAQTKEGVTCASCGLCAKAKRSVIIGFRFHGTAAKAAQANASAFQA